jgi:hypothetical protein
MWGGGILGLIIGLLIRVSIGGNWYAVVYGVLIGIGVGGLAEALRVLGERLHQHR